MKMWGKFLELIGMVIVLCGFLYGVKFSLMSFELTSLLVGSGVFYGGYLMEKKTG